MDKKTYDNMAARLDAIERSEQEKQESRERAESRNTSLQDIQHNAGVLVNATDSIQSKITNLRGGIADMESRIDTSNELLDEIKNRSNKVLVENPVEEVTVKNPTDSVRISNIKDFPAFPDEVTVKNPQEQVTVRNMITVEGVEKQLQHVYSIMERLPNEIASKQTDSIQPVQVQNATLDVYMLDPGTGRRIMPGAGYVDGGGSSSSSGGGGDGTQYKEGDIDASFTGTISMAEGPSNTATPLQVDASKNLQVDIAADSVGIGGGTQYNEDDAHGTGDTGTMALAVRNDTLSSLADTDGDYAPPQVDKDGALYVIEKNLVDTNNSSTSTLSADAVFQGTGTEVLHYSSITVYVEASHDSATDGLSLEYSSDNSNWDVAKLTSYTASEDGKVFVVPVLAQYFRVVYTNGSTEQTHFRLETILHANNVNPTDGRLSDEVSPERFGALTQSAIIAQASGAGNFVPVQSTNGGSLKVSLEEAEGLKGQATMANSVPVVIASDQSDISIDDGGNSITVDTALDDVVGTVGSTAPNNVVVIGAQDTAGNVRQPLILNTAFDAQDDTQLAILTSNRLFAYNGTTWDRLRGDDTNGLLVNLGSNNEITGTVTAVLSNTDNAVLDQIDSNTDYGKVLGGGSESTALRVTIANDSTGVLSIDDNGGSITVDGTVTANAGTGTFTIQEASALDVSAATVTVQATNLDIRNLTKTNDELYSVLRTDGGTAYDARDRNWTITETVSIDDNGGSITVDGTGTFTVQEATPLDVSAATVTVQATNLDVRTLTTADTVSAEPDGTAMSNNQITVDTTTGGTTVVSASAGRQGVTVKNTGSNTAYIGTGTVSTSNGFELLAGESMPLPTDSAVKAITASGTTTISYVAFA